MPSKAHGSSTLPPIWNKIFQHDSKWLNEMEELREIKPATLPTLVGHDLEGIMRGGKNLYLLLLVHDWSGELRYAKGALIESLRSFKYVSEEEVHILDTGITLNIAECLGKSSETGQIRLRDPRKMFALTEHQLHTSVLYYGDGTVHKLGPDAIGGIENRYGHGMKAVREICSIKMQLGDGKPVYRVFSREVVKARIRNVLTTDENGRRWVTHWRQIQSGWRERY